MDAKHTICRLLFDAFVEIRSQSRDSGDKASFHLADLFHNIPLQLAQTDEEESSYDDILARIHRRAAEKKMEKWLEQRIEAIECTTSEQTAAN